MTTALKEEKARTYLELEEDLHTITRKKTKPICAALPFVQAKEAQKQVVPHNNPCQTG